FGVCSALTNESRACSNSVLTLTCSSDCLDEVGSTPPLASIVLWNSTQAVYLSRNCFHDRYSVGEASLSSPSSSLRGCVAAPGTLACCAAAIAAKCIAQS